MKNLYIYRYTLIILFVAFISTYSYGQGCVAIRSFSGCGGNTSGSSILMPGESQIGVNFRYFHSFRHFRGSHEETERIEEGTNVINDSYLTDLSFNYAFAKRFYAQVTLPYVYHERSSMYEHGGNDLGERHKTYSRGLSDMRFGVGYWLFDEAKSPLSNIALAIGMKLPTGNPKAMDKFYNVGEIGQTDIRPVDQSIQPGDGGVGITLEMQGYKVLTDFLAINGNVNYLINPGETNGIERRPGREEFSIPDQYGARIGFNYITPLTGFDVYLGGRLEGIPAYDIIGSSAGYRRPGYAVSVEPGVNVAYKKFVFNFTVPIAVKRNRTQSYLDRERERETGEPRHGDAAFADYLVNFNVSYRFGAKTAVHDMSGSEDIN